MTEIKSGIRGLLIYPRFYRSVQTIFGASRKSNWLIERYVLPASGDRILDIGCGTGSIVAFLPDGVSYVGFEPNLRYVAAARRKFGDRAVFHTKYFEQADADAAAPVDIVLVVAVLHHLDDGQARELFRLTRHALKPGGRIVTLDNVYVEGQNPIARFLIWMDRGRNVRTQESYMELARSAFATVEADIVHHSFPPYTHIVMTAH